MRRLLRLIPHVVPASLLRAGLLRSGLRAALVALAAGCDGGGSAAGDGAPGADDLAADLRRARAAAFFALGAHRDLPAARAELAPLVASRDASADDLLRAALVEFHDTQADPAAGQAFMERALALAPGDIRVRWAEGLYARRAFDLERAATALRFVIDRDPTDSAAHLALGHVLADMDDAAGALAELEAVRSLGLGPNAALYVEATYVLRSLLFLHARDDQDRQRAQALMAERQALVDQGIKGEREELTWIGKHGNVEPPAPRPAPVAGPAPAFPEFGEPRRLDDQPASLLLAEDLDGDGKLELLTGGEQGLRLLRHDAPARVLSTLPVSDLAAGDLDPTPAAPSGSETADSTGTTGTAARPGPILEILVVSGGAAWLLEQQPDGAWAAAGGAPLLEGAQVTDALFADLDHAGGLDLVLATYAGLTWLRNDGRRSDGTWNLTDASPPGFAIGPTGPVLADDFDRNQAVDLLAVIDLGAHGVRAGIPVALAGMWRGDFVSPTGDWGLADALVQDGALWIGDVDGNGWSDVLCGDAEQLALRQNGPMGHQAPRRVLLEPVPTGREALADLNADGFLDLVGPRIDKFAGGGPTGPVLAWAGPLVERSEPIIGVTLGDGSFTSSVVVDLDGDLQLDLALAGPDGVELRRGRGTAHQVLLRLAGLEDNSRGVGAIVEARAGASYQRLWWRGTPTLLGLGGAERIDVLVVRWPNGVVQRAFDVGPGEFVLEQDPGAGGSCPFLYSWNGTTFEFISDVLGATPLGLPLADGVMVPFDHDEHVKLRGDQLVPRDDGSLELVLTEELREVTYLDHAALLAIDHPADTEIQPNEAFTLPPFPPHQVHVLDGARPLARVTASDGSDVTALVARIDGRHARPFVHRPPRYHGLTEPWHLELDLAATDAERAELALAPRIRLALTGWLLWPDASVNLGASRHAEIRFELPTLSVPDGDGWRAVDPPIGFVTGKTKTMVVDVTDLVDRADPRLRLSTTLALHWDAIRVALGEDGHFVESPAPPLTAELSFRGFSARVPDPDGEIGERFLWDTPMEPRWDQHEGAYTRYGDVAPLTAAIDDRYVIMGSGDALHLRFDARALPPLREGWTRDWLLHLDGWAKDRDPSTLACRTVEPLPFHGMEGYPPAGARAFPATPDELDWDARWNTRPGRTLLHDLAPRGR